MDTAGTSGPTFIERSTYYTDTPNMNGNRAQSNNYTLDGIDINEDFNNLIAYSPSPESEPGKSSRRGEAPLASSSLS